MESISLLNRKHLLLPSGSSSSSPGIAIDLTKSGSIVGSGIICNSREQREMGPPPPPTAIGYVLPHRGAPHVVRVDVGCVCVR